MTSRNYLAFLLKWPLIHKCWTEMVVAASVHMAIIHTIPPQQFTIQAHVTAMILKFWKLNLFT